MTIVQKYGTRDLWFTMKKYGTMEKKLRFYTENYGTIPKTMELWYTKQNSKVDYQNYESLIIIDKTLVKNNGNKPKQLKFLNKYKFYKYNKKLWN